MEKNIYRLANDMLPISSVGDSLSMTLDQEIGSETGAFLSDSYNASTRYLAKIINEKEEEENI